MSVMDLFREDALATVDRSTLENYATCPLMGRLKETGVGKSAGKLAEDGEEVHRSLGVVLSEYVASEGNMTPAELSERALSELRDARPDLQPDVVEASRRMLWPWARYVAGVNPHNILHYDGGSGAWSGQLAHDFETQQARVTSEIDLAHVGASAEVIEEVDYKTGWKKHTDEGVRESFQFQLHALLLMHTYPQVEEVRVRVWVTRHGYMTRRVAFTRGDLPTIEARVLSALAAWNANRNQDPADVEAWPVREKCALCDAVNYCTACDRDISDFALDPCAAVDTMAALEAKLGGLVKLARAYVKQHGEIVTPNGNAFGFDKPKKSRAPTATLYTVDVDEDGDDAEGES